MVNLRIATSETWRDKQSGERKERTEWHSVAIFNEALGKIAEQYLKKGSTVYIEGQLETRKWQDQSGAGQAIRPKLCSGRSGGELTLLGGRDGGGRVAVAVAATKTAAAMMRAARAAGGGYGGGGSRGGIGGGSGGGGGGGGRSDMDDEIPF